MKPKLAPGLIESYVERLIREAMERGELTGLEGEGRPLEDLDQPYDELWWVRKKLSLEGLSLALPSSLQLRREVERRLERARLLRDEHELKRELEELNRDIETANRLSSGGPATRLHAIDVDAWLARRRQARRR